MWGVERTEIRKLGSCSTADKQINPNVSGVSSCLMVSCKPSSFKLRQHLPAAFHCPTHIWLNPYRSLLRDSRSKFYLLLLLCKADQDVFS